MIRQGGRVSAPAAKPGLKPSEFTMSHCPICKARK